MTNFKRCKFVMIILKYTIKILFLTLKFKNKYLFLCIMSFVQRKHSNYSYIHNLPYIYVCVWCWKQSSHMQTFFPWTLALCLSVAEEALMSNAEKARTLFGISLSQRPKWQQFFICSSGFFFGYLVNGICEVQYIYMHRNT